MSLFTLSAPKTALSASTIDVFAFWSGTTPDARTMPLSLLSANRAGLAAGAAAFGSAFATTAGGGGVEACSVVVGEVVVAGAGAAGADEACGAGAVACVCVEAGAEKPAAREQQQALEMPSLVLPSREPGQGRRAAEMAEPGAQSFARLPRGPGLALRAREPAAGSAPARRSLALGLQALAPSRRAPSG